MRLRALDTARSCAPGNDSEVHVLVVARCAAARTALLGLLAGAGLQASATGAFGVVELLRGTVLPFDAVVVAQTLEESTLFGAPQLVRSFDADVPVLVVEHEAAGADGVVELIKGATLRWPVRERTGRVVN